MDQDEYWATLDLAGVRFGLHKANVEDFSQSSLMRGGATVTFAVADIDEAYNSYKSKGVKFLSEISRNPWGSHVSFTDSDGNL